MVRSDMGKVHDRDTPAIRQLRKRITGRFVPTPEEREAAEATRELMKQGCEFAETPPH